MGQQESIEQLENQEEGIHEEIIHKKEFDFVFWLGIILLLIFLGFNILTYLGNIGEYIRKLFSPILSFFGIVAGETTKQTLQTSGTGSKGIIDAVTNTATSGINLLQNRLASGGSNTSPSKTPSSPSKTPSSPSKTPSSPSKTPSSPSKTPSSPSKTPSSPSKTPSSPSKTPSSPSKTPSSPSTTPINSSVSQKLNSNNVDIHPTGISSSISINKSEKTSTGEPGYCYIGEDKGFRSCINVDSSHKCLSGDIFPTKDKCINPNLR